MQTIQDILKKFNPVEDKYISREFQTYAIYLSQVLNDEDHKSLYMKLAKTIPRAILERALSFVIDSPIDNKAKLFMWKMKELRQKTESTSTKPKRSKRNVSTKTSTKKNKLETLRLFP